MGLSEWLEAPEPAGPCCLAVHDVMLVCCSLFDISLMKQSIEELGLCSGALVCSVTHAYKHTHTCTPFPPKHYAAHQCSNGP